MSETTTPEVKPVTEVLLGCDPQLNVRVTENDNGTLFIVVEAVDPDKDITDIDGIFFNLADDSTLGSLNFFPEANEGSIFSPVTGVQAAADAVNKLDNGATVADNYDVGVQFGTTDNSTAGEVAQANFTLFSDDGPLSFSDLDLDSFAAVIDSDGGNGQVLTTADAPGDDPVLVSKQALFDDFDGLNDAEDSAIVEGHTDWTAAGDKLVSNGGNDGELLLQSVDTDGPVTLSFDASVNDTHRFENSGHAEDSLRVEVQIDGGPWVLLDEFQVNDAGTQIVGSETGQTFNGSADTISYSGGILDTAEDTVQFRFISDISASGEMMMIDNVAVNTTMEMDGGMQTVETTLLSEDFTGIHDPADSDNIFRDGSWDVRDGELATDGHNDGYLRFEPVEADGDVSLSFDARVGDASRFEATGHAADDIRLQVRVEDGSWETIDTFTVNSAGTALVGDQSGNQITEDGSTLNYSGGQLDDVDGNFEFRLVSDISAGDEQVFFDNFEVVETSGEGTTSHDCPVISEGFEGLSSGDVVSDQFEGITVTAQRAGDRDDSENDAMIFDTNNPTGGDHDLEFADQGNAIIISEDNDSSDADDEAHGGTISFEFETVSEVQSLSLLDIEEAGGTIDLFDADGALLNSVDIPAAGDGSAQEISIDTTGVSSMDVNLVGSGAVDDLVYAPDCECDAQYDVGYMGGVPMLPPVADEPEETEEEMVDDYI